MRSVLRLASVLSIFLATCSSGLAQTPSIDADANSAGDLLADDLRLVERIRKKILATTAEKAQADMADYRGTIPQLKDEPYDMVAIPGGKFLMGSAAQEIDREGDEGPQCEVEVAPFWMGKYEITWDQFEDFMITPDMRNGDGSLRDPPKNPSVVDIVSMPTSPYVEMSFGMGKEGFPAICMTQHAASKFCQWLSAQTGHYYRLPTEAEWEYACRAGTTTAYSFGDDPALLTEYAWFWNGQDEGDGVIDAYRKVGTKKPNPWGLYDMHGNVMEWCLDQYFPDGYVAGRSTVPATQLYPRVARGGSWYDEAEWLRSAKREQSSGDWQAQDPELPKSQWYLTDALWLGFRIVRPLEVPDAKTMHALWNSGAAPNR